MGLAYSEDNPSLLEMRATPAKIGALQLGALFNYHFTL